ncbi:MULTISPECIES: 30S ribosomal protein S9 [unclassified Conexibacter]|uniref:30S ribosomal protein S9 n=1 Tax=unclassified Conexibacter TaxID=2627773 RepID=UPI00351CAF0A
MSDVEQPEDERNPAGETPEEPVEAANEAPEPVAEAAPPADEAAEQPAVQEQPKAEGGDEELLEEEIEETPRVKPEIPGADLVPDIVLEGEPSEDDDEDDEATASGDSDSEDEVEAQPIADAAISLAADARYTATGKRKTAVARVILKPGTGQYTINGKPLDDFFPRPTLQRNIRQPLEAVGFEERMDVIAKMHGGGVSAQAGALRHGISRALLVADPNLRGELKKRGFLTRDPRVKERKKAGLKKARKRPQFSKR